MKQQLLFGILAFISPGSFWIADIYVDQYEGWGQWAAAPILLIPLIFSLVMTIVGVIMIIMLIRQKATCRIMTALTLVAISPWIYTLLR